MRLRAEQQQPLCCCQGSTEITAVRRRRNTAIKPMPCSTLRHQRSGILRPLIYQGLRSRVEP
eukprot:scaffold1883_cov396-Prasinococcus_capsulatus_cf.AAC.40